MQPVIRNNQYMHVDRDEISDIKCTERESPFHEHIVENGVFIKWVLNIERYNDSIRQQRATRYKTESDPLKIEAEYDAMVAKSEPDYKKWIEAVQKIKNELQYK
jgi:hypothetical protein